MKRRVLVLCTGNSCRSQMAEAIFSREGWTASSAGSHPSGYVHPLAIQVMKELEIDIRQNQSKSLVQFQNESFDLVVTVCNNAKEVCPVFPRASETLHWPFDDPAAFQGAEDAQLKEFRRIRDEIEQRIVEWLRGT